MAILKIARMGHPVLAQKAAPVPDHAAPGIRQLVRSMIETMADANGAGLAAPQVHVPLRLAVFQAPEERAEDNLSEAERYDRTAPLTVLLYPQRMRDLTKLIFESEARHWAPRATEAAEEEAAA
jgi:peptide deformylase